MPQHQEQSVERLSRSGQPCRLGYSNVRFLLVHNVRGIFQLIRSINYLC